MLWLFAVTARVDTLFLSEDVALAGLGLCQRRRVLMQVGGRLKESLRRSVRVSCVRLVMPLP